MNSPWPSSAIVTADPRVESCELDHERVLLDMSSSRYYSLNKVGNYVWEIIANPTSVGELQHFILSKFDVDADQCRKDLELLLTQLSRSALINVQHGLAA